MRTERDTPIGKTYWFPRRAFRTEFLSSSVLNRSHSSTISMSITAQRTQSELQLLPASTSFSPFRQQIRGPLPPLAQEAIKCIKMRFSLGSLQPGSNNKGAERDQLPVGEIGHNQQSAKNTACSSHSLKLSYTSFIASHGR